MTNGERKADVVLEGGGVRGLGAAGAVIRLLEDGYTFPRAAGTSVGAIAAALVAAGADAKELRGIMERLDLSRVPDRRPPGLPVVSEGVGLLGARGAYRGDWIREWIEEELAELGVSTFADLRADDPGADAGLTDDQKYKLVVLATDVTRGRLLRLPWDYHLFGLKAEEQKVADAVRCSLSIPFYFQPCALTDPVIQESSVIVDGGILSNFAVDIFDRTDGKKARWPTFGVRIIPDLPAGIANLAPLAARVMYPPLVLLQQVVTTALVGRDQTSLERPGVRERTMDVDCAGVGVTDFRIGPEARDAVVERGREAAAAFLQRWKG
ncbi:Patatin [Streptomyces sp. SDr-06]|uniref:patatin-like phospholipase family protein n=1 Tax=Streptomyces sp. SDr-06 TaxID=2267702 RepID=UPI000DE909CF|nr:patatin-like phospholipase family protein [Streptomyces sp. SDr-06]RCH65746.1 Patatin [Streptomyces sp. SDr-06]